MFYISQLAYKSTKIKTDKIWFQKIGFYGIGAFSKYTNPRVIFQSKIPLMASYCDNWVSW